MLQDGLSFSGGGFAPRLAGLPLRVRGLLLRCVVVGAGAAPLLGMPESSVLRSGLHAFVRLNNHGNTTFAPPRASRERVGAKGLGECGVANAIAPCAGRRFSEHGWDLEPLLRVLHSLITRIYAFKQLSTEG